MKSSMFTCAPNCANRKPGCHDHCEKYKKERTEYDKRKAVVDKDREARQYTMNLISKRADTRAKNKLDNHGRKWYKSG